MFSLPAFSLEQFRLPAMLFWGRKKRSTDAGDGLVIPQERPWAFDVYYAEHIQPLCQHYEQDRLQQLAKSKSRKKLLLPILLVVETILLLLMFFPSMFDMAHNEDRVEGMIHLGIGLAVAGGSWIWYPRWQFKQRVKEELYPVIFRFFGDDYVFIPKGQLTSESLKPSGIIPSYGREKIEDYIKGSYEGVSLEFTEATLTRGSGKHKRTLFDGIYIRLSMRKPFSGQTVLLRNQMRLKIFSNSEIRHLEAVTLEDPTFNQRFDVYSNDQVEARYLLTPAFMERLLNLESIMNSSGIQASFYENHLLLMLPSSHNRFEGHCIDKPATFYSDINVILAEMHELFCMIEHLKLHEDHRL